VVDPFFVTPTAIGLAYGAAFWAKYGIRGSRNICAVGMSEVGKSAFEYCLRRRRGGAIYDYGREETVERGQKYRAKVPGAARHFRSQDAPWWDVKRLLEDYDPAWIIMFIDVNNWQREENWKVLGDVCDYLSTQDYRYVHDPRFFSYYSILKGEHVERKTPFTGRRGCKLMTIALNKIDLWRQYHPGQQGEWMRFIADHFLKDRPDNPLQKIKGRIHYEFISVSLFDGIYHKYPRFYGEPKEFKDYLQEVSRQI
jgi:hypothetical protein